jgi:IS605 OrfB family transposase
MKLVAQVKLQPSEAQTKQLLATLEAANAAANFLSDLAWEHKTFRQFDLHQAGYRAIREQFGLSAQMAVRCISKVTDAYKLDKRTRRSFRPLGSIAYDDRILSWQLEARTVSLWTVAGRVKLPFVAGERSLAMLARLRGECDLVYRATSGTGEFYLYQTCEIEEAAEQVPQDFLGVDFGIVNIATTSDGETFSGAKLEATRQWHDTRQKKLQRVGSLAAKRRLRKLSGRQRRFQKDTNHKIAHSIVETAQDTARGIALEELGGIRERATVRRRQRARHSNWSFHQLRAFIEYKAKLTGVVVQTVDPRHSSKTCSVCGHCDSANRPTRDDFLCSRCGHAAPADWNAALNLRARAAVLRPMVSDTQRTSCVTPETSPPL